MNDLASWLFSMLGDKWKFQESRTLQRAPWTTSRKGVAQQVARRQHPGDGRPRPSREQRLQLLLRACQLLACRTQGWWCQTSTALREARYLDFTWNFLIFKCWQLIQKKNLYRPNHTSAVWISVTFKASLERTGISRCGGQGCLQPLTTRWELGERSGFSAEALQGTGLLYLDLYFPGEEFRVNPGNWY